MSKISFTLDEKEIQRALRELRQYKSRLDRKSKEIAHDVAKELKQHIRNNFPAQYDDLYKEGGMSLVKVHVTMNTTTTGTVVIASGENLVWVEFGAGVHYNGAVGSKPNPLADNAGMTGIGQRGEGMGARDTWFFKDDTGAVHATHGTPAQRPLYEAIQAVIPRIPIIAKGVMAKP